MLRRHQANLERWLDEQEKIVKRAAMAQRKITFYRTKTRYYRARVAELEDTDIGRALRSIDLDGGGSD